MQHRKLKSLVHSGLGLYCWLAAVTVDPCSAEKSFGRTRQKYSAEMCGYTTHVNSGD